MSSQPPASLLLFLQSAPPRVTLDAFQEDCRLCGMPWYSLPAQRLCVVLFIENPLVRKYPPRASNVHAFLKALITQIEQTRNESKDASQENGEDTICVELLEAYIGCTAQMRDGAQQQLCYKTLYTPGAAPSFVSVRLAAGQFSNVGLALWPAAFVLVQLLDAELSAPSPELTDGLGETLRLLELGAGVGLTPLLLHHLRPYNERVSRFVLTDYQQELVENISFNLNERGLGLLGSAEDAAQCGRVAVHSAELLDWTEHEQNRAKLSAWRCNVVVAADCVYDIPLIPSLVQTIRSALELTEGAVAIVVQTHRQRETMCKFFTAVHEAEMTVQSYYVAAAADAPLLKGSVVHRFPSHVRTQSRCTDNINSSCDGFVLVRVEGDPTFPLLRRDGEEAAQATSGWLGSSFISLEAVVGVHVLRVRSS
ncbi:hypothetical protein TRVL_09416 [Trypanosoma vivax]|nr:hypothetical protein TRVL_09416 [Trypanosoma vivax]